MLSSFRFGEPIPANSNSVISIDARAALDKAESLYNMGKYNEAIKYYDKVLAINPNDTEALNNEAKSIDNFRSYGHQHEE